MKVKRIISLILVGIMTFLMVSGIEINTVEADKGVCRSNEPDSIFI